MKFDLLFQITIPLAVVFGIGVFCVVMAIHDLSEQIERVGWNARVLLEQLLKK